MEVGQPGIKINQMNQLQSSLPFKLKQKEDTILSFNQILAAAALGGQELNKEQPHIGSPNPTVLKMTNNTLGTLVMMEENVQDPSLNSLIGTTGESSSNPSDIKIEGLNDIVSILASLGAVLQQYQITSKNDGNSQTSMMEGLHNPGDRNVVHDQVYSDVLKQSNQILVDPETLQISPDNSSLNNRLFDTLVPEVFQDAPIQTAISTSFDFSTMGLKKNGQVNLPIESIGKENLKSIQPIIYSVQSDQLEPGSAISNQDPLLPDDLGLNDPKDMKIDTLPNKNAIQNIQIKIAEILKSFNPKTWNEHMDNGSFLHTLSSLLDDIQVFTNSALPDQVNEIVRKLNTSVEQLLISFPGPQQDQRKNSPEFSLNFETNKILFSPNNQEKKLPESNRLRNIMITPQNEPFIMDGQVSGLNQTLTNPNHSNIQNEVESIPILPVNNFVPEINELVGRFVKLNKGELGSTEAKFSLFPENLGHVGVKIITNDGQITAQIMTETPAAKQALEGQLHLLRQALLDQGLVVQKLDILQQSVPANSNQADLSFSQGNSGFSREQRTYDKKDNDLKKQSSLENLEVDEAVVPISYQGAVTKGTSNIDFSA